jgi:hypothetical protein
LLHGNGGGGGKASTVMAAVSRSVAAVGEEMFGMAKCVVALFIYQCSKKQQSAGGCAFFDINVAVFEYEAVQRTNFLKGFHPFSLQMRVYVRLTMRDWP